MARPGRLPSLSAEKNTSHPINHHAKPEASDRALITEQRLKLRALGYNPLPLRGKAVTIAGWQKRTETTEHEIREWARVRPAETNTGLLTRNRPAFDVDILSRADVADAAADVIETELAAIGGRVAVRFGRKPKRAFLCRTDTPFKKIRVEFDSFFADTDEIKYDAIEILGDGQQIVCCGIHPDTGEAYEWVGGAPTYVPASDLPLITEADARSILDKIVVTLAERFGINVRTAAKGGRVAAATAEAKTTDTATAYGAAALRSACEMLVNATSHQDDTRNSECYGIGRLVGGGELPEAEALAELQEAAAQMPDLDPARPWDRRLLAKRVADSFAQGKANPRAAAEGELLEFTFGDEAVTDGDAKPDETRHAFEAMSRVYVRARLANGGEHPKYTEKVAAELGPQYREAFLKIDLFNLVDVLPGDEAVSALGGITVGRDADWTNVDGVLGEMRDWILATSPYPNRRMAVMAAFAALSGTTARHLYTPTGLGLGLVMAMLARTTVGKDAPLSAVAKILYAAGLGHMSQPAKSFTVSGFEQSLINSNGACVATGDEIGENLLARISAKRRCPTKP